MVFDTSLFPSFFSVVDFAVVVVVDSFDLFASHFRQSNLSVVLTMDSAVVVDVTVIVLVEVLVVVVSKVVVVVVVLVFSVVVDGNLSVVYCHLSCV